MGIDKNKTLKILVTGGSGFLGSHLVDSLLDDGFNVTVFDNKKTKFFTEKAEWFFGDITDLQQTQQVVRNHDGVIHLAAISRVKLGNENPYRCIKVNALGTANILEGVKNSKTQPWVILGSTIDALGESLFLCNEVKQPENMVSFYESSKFISELLCKQYSYFYGLKTMVLRFGDIYGSIRDHREKVLPIFVANVLNNKKPQINPSAKMFNFIYWKDLVDGIKRSIEYIEDSNMGFYDEFVLSANTQTSLKNLAELIENQIHGKPSVNEVYNDTTYSLGLENKTKKTKNRLGFSPIVGLQKGLRLYIEECRREKIF